MIKPYRSGARRLVTPLSALAAATLALAAPLAAHAMQDKDADTSSASADAQAAAQSDWDIVDSTDGELTLIRHDSLSGPTDARKFEAEHRYTDGTADRAVLVANCTKKTLALRVLNELTDGKVTKTVEATGDMAQPHSAEGKASTEGMIAYACADAARAAQGAGSTR